MRQRMLFSVTPLLLLACVVFAAVPGRADAISDTLTVYNPAGIAVQIITAMESDEAAGNTFFFIGAAGYANAALVNQATALCETTPCNAMTSPRNYSDEFGVFQVGPNVYLGFVSDAEQGIIHSVTATHFMVEMPGVSESATMYLTPAKIHAGWTATFVSDGEPPIPEPSTLVLLGSGLLGLAGFARRRVSR